MEYKASKTFTMGIDGRTVTGIFAVHGNVDDGDGWSSRDRSHPGMFGDFTVDGRKRAVFLWQHNSMEPPTATIDQLFEVARADLPPAVLKYAPDTTGGTAIKRTYLETARASEVFAALSSGALSEMSYSYDPTRWDFEKGPSDSDIRIRNLYEADLYDVSDVNWGMNPATSADGAKGLDWKAQPLLAHAGAVEAAIADLAARLAELKQRRLKEGRTFSSANYTALNGIADSLDGLTVDLRGVLDSAEPKQKNDMRRLLLETQRTLARLNGVV
jgi:hypothetical protein